MKDSKKDFNPNILHPFYFLRNGLYKHIEKQGVNFTGNLLDFGCGSKPYKSLFKNVTGYVGVDFDGEGHSHENELIDVLYDGKKLPFSDESFDGIFSSEVFEHVFNLEDILPELFRVLKSGSKILVTCPFAWDLHEKPVDFARYTTFGLFHLFNKNGFENIRIEKAGNYISTLTQLKILYFSTCIRSKYPFFLKSKYIFTFIILIMNLIGLFKLKVFPNGDDLYLSNILIAQKP
jgi:SAM-dependent methyltransferase